MISHRYTRDDSGIRHQGTIACKIPKGPRKPSAVSCLEHTILMSLSVLRQSQDRPFTCLHFVFTCSIVNRAIIVLARVLQAPHYGLCYRLNIMRSF